jgi:hypothetical protein
MVWIPDGGLKMAIDWSVSRDVRGMDLGMSEPDFGGPSVAEIAERQAQERAEQVRQHDLAEHQRQMLGSAGYSLEQLRSLLDNVVSAPGTVTIGTVSADPWLPRVGDRVRVRGLEVFADLEGIVEVVSEGLRQCDVRFPARMNRSYGFKWDNLERVDDVRGTHQMKISMVSEKGSVDCGTNMPGYRPERDLPQKTFAATLELEGGRLVDIPGPDPAIWEQVEEKSWDAAERMRVRLHTGENATRADVELRYMFPDSRGGGILLLGHDAARCWAYDMARVVNEQGPVGMDPQKRGALLRSLRTYRRRPPVDPHADRAYPTLRAFLW